MSIARLNKVTLVGLTREKETLLDTLQSLGCLHLTKLAPEAEEAVTPPSVPEEAYEALKYLNDCPRKRHQVLVESDFCLQSLVEEVLQNRRRVREVSDLRDFIAQRIKDLEPWGDFRLPPLEELAGCRLWFYPLPADRVDSLPRGDLAWQIVHRDQRFAYVVVISRAEPPAGLMPAPRVHTGSVPLSALRMRLNETELELDDLLSERECLTRWIYLIGRNLARARDEEDRAKARAMTLDRGELFGVQGWVAEKHLARLEDYASRRQIVLVVETPEPGERPPTLLEEPTALAAGEDLVSFYQLPPYRGWDPAPTVFFSFTLFFAMILSDAGYGLLLALLLAAFWRRLGRSLRGRRLRVLAASLVSVTVLWGVLIGSYFGFSPPPESLAARFKWLDLNHFDAMMRLSVIIGVLHLSLALIGQARSRPSRRETCVPLGWMAVLLGATAWWLASGQPSTIAETVRTGATAIAAFGGAAVFVCSGRRPLKRPVDLLLRLWEGFAELTQITRMFGDVLSYLRLFALGLASASLALTFNGLAQQAMQSESGLGLLFGLLIIIIGHALNLVLSLMSGVVHGLRLNFIEFYNWGLSDEGYPFKPFAKREKRE